MKKVLSIKNMGLLLIIVLIAVLTINTKEAKAAGTVTWVGSSSVTITTNVDGVSGPVSSTFSYGVSSRNEASRTATRNLPADITVEMVNQPISNNRASLSANFDFSGTSFVKTGDFEYTITSSVLNDLYTRASGTGTYVIVASVRNEVDANNTPTGNYVAKLLLKRNNTKLDSLTANFNYHPDESKVGTIVLLKTVKGIGADTTKYFPFTISISDEDGIFDGWVYPIEIYDASSGTNVTNDSITYNGQTRTQPTSITSGGSPVTVYLKHNQAAEIGVGENSDLIPTSFQYDEYTNNGGGIIGEQGNYSFDEPRLRKLGWETKTAGGSYFTIEEDQDDYTASFFLNGGDSTTGYYVAATNVNDGTNIVVFVNTKEMSPVTGLIFTIFPYVILIGIGIGGALLFINLKKKKAVKSV